MHFLKIAEESNAFFNDILHEVYDQMPKSVGDYATATADQIQLAFIYRHAKYLNDLAADVIALQREGREASMSIVVRTMLESLFKLVSAINQPSFAAEKVIAESEFEVKQIQKWQAASNDDDESLNVAVKQLQEFASAIRSNNGITSKIGWNVYQTAVLADLDETYMSDYFMFSKFVHGTTGGIISLDHGLAKNRPMQTCLMCILIAAGHLVQVLPTLTPQKHLDRSMELMKSVIQLTITA